MLALKTETHQHKLKQFQNVTKMYGGFAALKGVSLDIRDNEFFTLLGPSGCGKTTLLRAIAGFEEVSSGAIILYGQNIADLLPTNDQSTQCSSSMLYSPI